MSSNAGFNTSTVSGSARDCASPYPELVFNRELQVADNEQETTSPSHVPPTPSFGDPEGSLIGRVIDISSKIYTVDADTYLATYKTILNKTEAIWEQTKGNPSYFAVEVLKSLLYPFKAPENANVRGSSPLAILSYHLNPETTMTAFCFDRALFMLSILEHYTPGRFFLAQSPCHAWVYDSLAPNPEVSHLDTVANARHVDNKDVIDWLPIHRFATIHQDFNLVGKKDEIESLFIAHTLFLMIGVYKNEELLDRAAPLAHMIPTQLSQMPYRALLYLLNFFNRAGNPFIAQKLAKHMMSDIRNPYIDRVHTIIHLAKKMRSFIHPNFISLKEEIQNGWNELAEQIA